MNWRPRIRNASTLNTEFDRPASSYPIHPGGGLETDCSNDRGACSPRSGAIGAPYFDERAMAVDEQATNGMCVLLPGPWEIRAPVLACSGGMDNGEYSRAMRPTGRSCFVD